MPSKTIHVTLPALLALSYGDDAHFHNRCWLGIYTLAAGCRVIDKALAEEVFALDRAEQLAHIEVYETRTYTTPLFDRFPESYRPRAVSELIYTLWPTHLWLESNERVRLTRAKCRALHVAVTKRDICEHISRVAATQIAGRGTEYFKLAMTGMLAQAAALNYNVAAFLNYLDQLAIGASLKDLSTNEPADLTSKHRAEFLVDTTTKSYDESRSTEAAPV